MADAPPAGKPAPVPAAPARQAAPAATAAPGAPPAAATAAAPPAAKAAVPAAPAPPAPKPAGDHAALATELPGSTYAVLDDGAGVVTVAGDLLPAAAHRVRAMGYGILSVLSAYDRTDHFGILYAFVKPAATPAEFGEMRLRVTMPKAAGEPTVPSIVDLFPAAGWHEREMFDMYGIRFEGNPDLRRMFLPDDWTGYPMRKDYKEPEQFVGMREGEDVTVRTPQEGAW